MKENVIAPVAAKGTGTVTQEGGITTKKVEYTFRTLNSTDMFLMFKILGKIGINELTDCFSRDSVKQLIAKFSNGDDEGTMDGATTILGISVILEIANVIMCNIGKCEAEIYQLLSNVSGLKVDKIKKLDPATFTEMVIDFIKKEEFTDFIGVVLRSFKLTK